MRDVSEFTSYIFIKNELSLSGWNTKNPNRNEDGEVYTQQEVLSVPEVKEFLGLRKPEYSVKIGEDKYYIIEAKGTVEEINLAFNEAVSYGESINNSDLISAPIVSGVAGNDDDGYIVKSAFFENGAYKTINYHGNELTSLVSKEQAQTIIEINSSNVPVLEINEEKLLKTAEDINEILHNGSINKDERAAVMATLLLSLIDETLPNYNASPTVFVNDINNRAEEVLIQHNKREFFKHIQIKLPSQMEAMLKYKKALVSTMFKLLNINIKAAMNSGNDILGKFYEVFLKYGNGAKDIGIVLTPRHIARFACEIIDVKHSDLVFDPTCGTGGFLVSAFDYVRENSTVKQVNLFKKHRIFGVEQQPKIASLAIVNMIFRGDGSNNIIDNNVLSIGLNKLILNNSNSAEYVNKADKDKSNPVNKVMMNPPFALKDKDEKEWKFIDHALEQMEDGGILFAIIPMSVLTKSGNAKKWRKDKLLKNNSLLSVISLPFQLFYPVGVHTCAIVVKKGISHKSSQSVFWARGVYDGYKIKKSKRIISPEIPNNVDILKNELKMFIQNQSLTFDDQVELKKICPIDFSDNLLELVPEAYIDQRVPTKNEIEKGIEKIVRENAAFLIRSGREGEFLDD